MASRLLRFLAVLTVLTLALPVMGQSAYTLGLLAGTLPSTCSATSNYQQLWINSNGIYMCQAGTPNTWVQVTGGGPTFPLLAPGGTSGAPSYSFADSPTTGIFEPSPSSNALNISTNAVPAISISSGQLVTFGNNIVEPSTAFLGTLGSINGTLAMRNATNSFTLFVTAATPRTGGNGALVIDWSALTSGSNKVLKLSNAATTDLGLLGSPVNTNATYTNATFVGHQVIDSGDFGTCTLNGAATSTCTATAPSACTVAFCTYQSSTIPHAVACTVSGGTLTAISLTTLDSGTVGWTCH